MAKRTVQLQVDLQNDEDFDGFLMTSGLLLIEIYSEWCGPCLGVVNTLRKIKYDVGDVLSLATARADTISYLQRFHKRSEPTWLFVKDGRALNIMFGTNCPRLVKLIHEEVHMLSKFHQRDTYNITELLPEEEKRDRIKNEAKEKQIREEQAAIERKKIEYFQYVTDTILENLPDFGVTIFGPHVNRDLYRKLMEFGFEKLGIYCKDRRNQVITKEQFEIINSVCMNPLSADVIDVIEDKELFICFWKIQDDRSKRTVPEVLELYAEEVTKPRTVPADEYRESDVVEPPFVSSLKMIIEYEIPDDQECPVFEVEPEPKIRKKQKTHTESLHEDIEPTFDDDFSEMGSEEDEELLDEPKDQSVTDMEFADFDFTSVEGDEEDIIGESPKKNMCKKLVTIPGIWVPKDQRTHAALIYVLFRQQTLDFLPPDPVPEPPHVIMAFHTYKQRDLIDFAGRYKDDIPLYGFFTSDEADEAKFIANNKQTYAHSPHSANDKLVFKVNKRTSHTMLSLVSYGPTYVSFDTEVGKQEALKFFPKNYGTAEEDLTQNVKETLKKEEKSKKGAKTKTSTELEYEKEQEEALAMTAEEAATAEQEKEAVDDQIVEEGQGEAEVDDGELAGEVEGEGEAEAEAEGGDIGEGVEIPPDTLPADTAEQAVTAQEPTATEPPTTEPAQTEPPATEPPTAATEPVSPKPAITETIETIQYL